VTVITDSICVFMVPSMGSAGSNMYAADVDGESALLGECSVLDWIEETLTKSLCGPSVVGVCADSAPFERVFSTRAENIMGFFSPKPF